MNILLLFGACLLIHGFEMSGAWYLIAIIVWVVDCFGSVYWIIYGTFAAIQKHDESKPGIRGSIKKDGA